MTLPGDPDPRVVVEGAPQPMLDFAAGRRLGFREGRRIRGIEWAALIVATVAAAAVAFLVGLHLGAVR